MNCLQIKILSLTPFTKARTAHILQHKENGNVTTDLNTSFVTQKNKTFVSGNVSTCISNYPLKKAN